MSGLCAQAQQPQIFFSTVATITGRDMHRPDPLAYMDFFKPDAPWQRSASSVNSRAFGLAL